MITLTRLSGSMFALNSDLIERVDSTPDSVVTLVDGTTLVAPSGELIQPGLEGATVIWPGGGATSGGP